MAILKFAPLLLLAACATETQLAPPIEVKVPVSVPCRAPNVPKPVWPMDSLPAGASIYDQAKSLIAEIEARIAYEIQLESAVKACQ
jgi:hypothetical protein